jgi:hypothetical protein
VSIRKLSNLLRSHRPAIMSLTSDDAVVIDLRCITHLEEKILEDAFAEIDNRLQGN